MNNSLFDKNDFKELKKYVGKNTYDGKSPILKLFKAQESKLKDLAKQLATLQELKLELARYEQMHKQAGRGAKKLNWAKYILAGYNSNKTRYGKTLFLKFVIHEIDKIPLLTLEVDVDRNSTKEKAPQALVNYVENTEKATQKYSKPLNYDLSLEAYAKEIQKEFSNVHSFLINCENYYYKSILSASVSSNTTKDNNTPQPPLNQILYGPPGTGKTYHTINKALEIIDPSFDSRDRKKVKEDYQRLVKSGQIMFTTFHQSMSYEDFVEGIKPIEPTEEDTYLKYEIEDGVFKKLCKQAQQTQKLTLKVDEDETELTPEVFLEHYATFAEQLPTHTEEDSQVILYTQSSQKAPFKLYKNSKNSIVAKAGVKQTPMVMSANELSKVLFENKAPVYRSYEQPIIDKILENVDYNTTTQENQAQKYVLIIDEINRGNVSAIFGELITLIEQDKRTGADEALSVILPYSKQVFSVPKNVYIIGTMNTADRSIEALDNALRRRFWFTEMRPDSKLLTKTGTIGKHGGVIENIDVTQMLEAINPRIEKLIDKDHQIGHAYFLNVDTLTDLKAVFKDKVIPLLEEYFFGDLGKISLVLGDTFIRKNTENVGFAKNHQYDSLLANDLADRAVYTITPTHEWDFKTIYA